MTKLRVITFALFFVYALGLKAQSTDLFAYMEEHLTSEETSAIDRAKSSLKKGDMLESKIKAEDRKNSKYFKKKKKKKAEKKSYEAKKLRIQQAIYYEKAYLAIYNTYLDKVNACSFYYPDDKSKVEQLLSDADQNVSAYGSEISFYKRKNKKELKKTVAYLKLKNSLKSALDGYVSSINNLITAYSIYIDQDKKKKAEEEENRAWENAESDNTINSYRSYLNAYSDGLHSDEARRRIRKLEKIQEEASRKITGNLIYRVQIAASRTPLPKWKLARIYRKTGAITKKHYNDWYKYSIGAFQKYEQAKDFLSNSVKVPGAFVVAYVDGEKIDIQAAIKGQ